MEDITTQAFLALRKYFLDQSGQPKAFQLRAKRNTQDDPFDDLLAYNVLVDLPGVQCEKSSGPLINPDMVLYREALAESPTFGDPVEDLDLAVAVEVKKLERSKQGNVARSSGLDFNTTPPCGRVRVYDAEGSPLDVRSFYLFACLEGREEKPEGVLATALALVDGSVLNDDFSLYLSIVGRREKEIGLGSYGDGANRNRPMLIFSNPLGVRELDFHTTLIHPSGDLEGSIPELRMVHRLKRTRTDKNVMTFFCYRWAPDVPADWMVTDLLDAFPTPTRQARTALRGRFKLPFSCSSSR